MAHRDNTVGFFWWSGATGFAECVGRRRSYGRYSRRVMENAEAMRLVSVRRLVFEPWGGPPVANRYGNKAIASSFGRPRFAELAALDLMRAEGWEGVWVDTFGAAYRTGMLDEPPVDLPETHRAVLDGILARDTTARPWDLLLWKPGAYLFVELKRMKKDHIRDSQRAFLRAALETGMPLSAFMLVEWTLKP
jgi:hypothetical protein